MIKYYKLFDMLMRRDMKKTDLLKIISAPTLAKLSKGETVKTDIIDKICIFLECQPGDIMECVKDLPPEELMTDKAYHKLYERFEIYQDIITEEEFRKIVDKCIVKKTRGEVRINEDKLIRLIKENYINQGK